MKKNIAYIFILTSLFVNAQIKKVSFQNLKPEIKKTVHQVSGIYNVYNHVEHIEANKSETLYAVNLNGSKKIKGLTKVIITNKGNIKKKVYRHQKLRQIKNPQLVQAIKQHCKKKGRIKEIMVVENYNNFQRYVIVYKNEKVEFNHNYQLIKNKGVALL